MSPELLSKMSRVLLGAGSITAFCGIPDVARAAYSCSEREFMRIAACVGALVVGYVFLNRKRIGTRRLCVDGKIFVQ
jgi:hypothetical protein